MTTLINTLEISEEYALVLLRNIIRDQTNALGFSLLEQTKFITAASELARNILLYATSGKVLIEKLNNNGRFGLKLTFEDKGPGISDLKKAMENGFSTGKGLGMGLPGAKRLVNEFVINSTPGKGTVVQITVWKHGR
jgi:serine/threonine-protein kinase RsbT